jgi:DNA invertase Pin-like site-specific DNA recombinase
MTTAAYLRRSVSKDPTKEVSREAQEGACRRMAGAGPLTLYVDWGMSGGTSKRPEYQRLRADVEAGTVSAVVAYSISRLARSARELLDFLDLCKARNVTVTTEAEGTIGGRGAFGKFVNLIMAGLAEMERDLASERTLAAHAVRRERGDHIGPAPYGFRLAERAAGQPRGLVPDPGEDFGAVVAAYGETHSLHGSARRLNAQAIPTRNGRPWSESAVRGMLRARAPELLPRVKGTRAGARGYLFTGLLVCPHDGTRLAPKANHGRWAAYSCRRAYDLVDHPHPRAVSEAFILPWVRDEIAHLRLPDAVTLATDNAGQRDALTGRLERAHELYIAGAITRERHDREAAAVAAELDRLGAAEAVVAVPRLDWTWAPRDVNAILRAILESVTLGPDLRPVSAVWTMPEWRQSG